MKNIQQVVSVDKGTYINSVSFTNEKATCNGNNTGEFQSKLKSKTLPRLLLSNPSATADHNEMKADACNISFVSSNTLDNQVDGNNVKPTSTTKLNEVEFCIDTNVGSLSDLKEEVLRKIGFDFIPPSYVADYKKTEDMTSNSVDQVPDNITSSVPCFSRAEIASSAYNTEVHGTNKVTQQVHAPSSERNPSDVLEKKPSPSSDNLARAVGIIKVFAETDQNDVASRQSEADNDSGDDDDNMDMLENGMSTVQALMNGTNVARFTTDYVLYILTQLQVMIPKTCYDDVDSDDVSQQEDRDHQEVCCIMCAHCKSRRFTYRNVNGLMRALTRTVASHFEVRSLYL